MSKPASKQNGRAIDVKTQIRLIDVEEKKKAHHDFLEREPNSPTSGAAKAKKVHRSQTEKQREENTQLNPRTRERRFSDIKQGIARSESASGIPKKSSSKRGRPKSKNSEETLATEDPNAQTEDFPKPTEGKPEEPHAKDEKTHKNDHHHHHKNEKKPEPNLSSPPIKKHDGPSKKSPTEQDKQVPKSGPAADLKPTEDTHEPAKPEVKDEKLPAKAPEAKEEKAPEEKEVRVPAAALRLPQALNKANAMAMKAPPPQEKPKKQKLQELLSKKDKEVPQNIPQKKPSSLAFEHDFEKKEPSAFPSAFDAKKSQSSARITKKSPSTMDLKEGASKRGLQKKKPDGPIITGSLIVKDDFSAIIPVTDKVGMTARENVAVEFLTTEITYVQGLELLVEKYIKPLREKNEDKGQGWDSVFLNIEALFDINYKFCSFLQERLSHWEEEGQDHLGDLISKIVPLLHEPYAQFSAGYGKAIQTLEKKTEANPHFRKVLEALDEEVSHISHLKHKDYFVTPIQRIPRYVLLIRDLQKQTSPDSRDFLELEAAGNEMSQLASNVNEYVRAQESAERMNVILGRGGGLERLNTEPAPTGRRLWLKESEIPTFASVDSDLLYSGKPKFEKKKNVNIILFSDILVSEAFVSKKAPYQDYSIPTRIMWILGKNDVPEGMTDFLKDEDWNNRLIIVGPEKHWCLGFKTMADQISWTNEFKQLQDVFVNSTRPNIRDGAYTFKDGSNYSGEWSNGWMNGHGTYQREREMFEGMWDAVYAAIDAFISHLDRNKVGFGTIRSPGGLPKVAGWKLKNGELSTADDEGMWSEDALTESDWNYLLSNSTIEKKPAGTVLIQQGKPNNSLMRCKTGTLSVQNIASDGTKTVLATLAFLVSPGAVVGDTSVLVSNIATASVVCGTACEIEHLSVALLYAQFHHNPALCMRFYRHMARKMTGILKGLHDPKKAPNQPKTGARGGSSTLKPTQSSQLLERKKAESSLPQFRFHLPPSTVLFLEARCTKQMFPRNKRGVFYLFESHIGFESQAFGASEVEIKALVKITDITYKRDVLTLSTKSKKLVFAGIKLDFGILTSVWSEAVDKLNNAREEGLPSPRFKAKAPSPSKQLLNSSLESPEKKLIEMSKEDWNLILSLSVEKKYKRGEYILKEGEERPVVILQLDNGRVKITKNNNDGTQKVIGTQESGISSAPPLFGEISFVESSNLIAASSANIIADSDDVSFSILEGLKLFVVFVAHPSMAGKFYSYLANLVARRVAEREASLRSPEPK